MSYDFNVDHQEHPLITQVYNLESRSSLYQKAGASCVIVTIALIAIASFGLKSETTTVKMIVGLAGGGGVLATGLIFLYKATKSNKEIANIKKTGEYLKAAAENTFPLESWQGPSKYYKY